MSKLGGDAGVVMKGFGPPYDVAINISSIVYGILGLFLCRLLVKEIFPKTKGWFLIYGIWLASPLLYFMVYESRMSHANAFFVNALFMYLLHKKLEDSSYKKFILIGLLLGLVTLIRWQDIIIVILPLSEILIGVYKKQLKLIRAIKASFLLLSSFLVLFSLQMLAWKVVYGKFLLLPPSNTVIDPFSPHISWFLFHPNYGAIIWHPILLIGILGLIFCSVLKSGKRFFGISALIVLGSAIYINSSLSDWYGGGAGSFGARRLISVLPLIFVGVLYLYENFGRKVKILTVIAIIFLSVWNISLLPQAGKNWLWGNNQFSGLSGFSMINLSEIIKNDFKILKEQLERFAD